MNIFALDLDPCLAARYHCDKHVVKMPLETAQIITAVFDRYALSTIYKPSFKNHPCTLWAGNSKQNFEWLMKLGIQLCMEYYYRFGKDKQKQHSCLKVLQQYRKNENILRLLPNVGFTDFYLAMPEDCVLLDPISSYRNYYIKYKKDLLKYTKRDIPFWLKEG